MAQKPRVRLRTVTESKMFSKKMHRLVKKIKDKPVDSLDLLSDMARKRGDNLSIPIEVENETQWTTLLKREGLIVVDVFSGWSGPCTSMFSILRKLKLDTNDDRLTMAAANADNIAQLAPFKNQSEPCWLFMGGGKPVNVMRGSNAPKLVRTIKSELQHELDCIEGKAKRNLISIKFESGRREKAVSEAITLNELMTLEEEEKKAREQKEAKSKSPTPAPNEDENESYSEMPEKEKSPQVVSQEEEHQDNEEEEEEKGEKEEVVPAEPVIDEAFMERRRQMEESNKRLKYTLRPYTVIAIQSYLIETGAVTEIKDHLAEEFNLVRERYINLNDEGARKLFGIPNEVPDPNPPQFNEELLERPETGEGTAEDDENADTYAAISPPPGEAEKKVDETGESKEDGTIEAETNEEHDDDETTEEKNRKTKKTRITIPMISIPIPELIVGDTLILLLECTKVKPVVEKKNDQEKEDNQEEGGNETEVVDENADHFILQRTGSVDYETAAASQPESLLALYGKEKYVTGVWCPRSYEQKRFVMLNYFPQFVTEMLMPNTPEPPNDTEDKLGENEVERQQLQQIQKTDVLAVSANGKNGDLIQILNCFDPIFSTNDALEAGYFTAKLFPDVEVLIDEDPFPEEEEEDTACGLANIISKFSEALHDEIATTTAQDETTDTLNAKDENNMDAAAITQDENAEMSDVIAEDAMAPNNDHAEDAPTADVQEEQQNSSENEGENGNDEAAKRDNQVEVELVEYSQT